MFQFIRATAVKARMQFNNYIIFLNFTLEYFKFTF